MITFAFLIKKIPPSLNCEPACTIVTIQFNPSLECSLINAFNANTMLSQKGIRYLNDHGQTWDCNRTKSQAGNKRKWRHKRVQILES